MKRANLRKVVFVLDANDYGHFDLEDDEREQFNQNAEEQQGFFHAWTYCEVQSPESNQYIIEKRAIIEKEDGSLVILPFNCIKRFIND